ncbi:hypothetical protein [Azospirillum isscasi]|uniref:Uncharacterized protein n=1 Tax=Azospirillum isscasi TaxID=3053926 RepID=A0ABU0WLE5_9PROT|nr:hypothetical protein [Azospirillum isscasi]MDQ2104996.1 hypothetical protein [Azospirillum isscasi]
MSALIPTCFRRFLSRRMTALGIVGALALAVLPSAADAHGPRDRGHWYGGPSVIVPPPGSRVIVVPGYRPPPPVVIAPPPYWGPPPRHHHRHRSWGNDWGPRPYSGPSVQFYGGWSSGRGW